MRKSGKNSPAGLGATMKGNEVESTEQMIARLVRERDEASRERDEARTLLKLVADEGQSALRVLSVLTKFAEIGVAVTEAYGSKECAVIEHTAWPHAERRIVRRRASDRIHGVERAKKTILEARALCPWAEQ